MRGKHYDEFNIMKYLRITPADAGKTIGEDESENAIADHPRGCGENHITDEDKRPNTGSPPRMRGKPTCFSGLCTNSRITPADAGKTYFCHFTVYRQQDHPRGCGENPYHNNIFQSNQGSPPRMRGKRILALHKSYFAGITPADAGKTVLSPAATSACRDHPRGCGENTRTEHYSRHQQGSPPRMRGKRQ